MLSLHVIGWTVSSSVFMSQKLLKWQVWTRWGSGLRDTSPPVLLSKSVRSHTSSHIYTQELYPWQLNNVTVFVTKWHYYATGWSPKAISVCMRWWEPEKLKTDLQNTHTQTLCLLDDCVTPQQDGCTTEEDVIWTRAFQKMK